jgi:hypothetical protein
VSTLDVVLPSVFTVVRVLGADDDRGIIRPTGYFEAWSKKSVFKSIKVCRFEFCFYENVKLNFK